MSRSKYEKMDIMLEEIMNEGDISQKVNEMKEELNKIEQGVTGANKKEYKENLAKVRVSKKGLENKIKFYENFEKNKKQILNIRDYQIELQSRLDGLEDIYKKSEYIKKEIKVHDKKLEEMDKKLKSYRKELDEINNKLKGEKLSVDEIKELKDKKSKLQLKMEDQNVSYSFSLRKKMEYENMLKDSKSDQIENQILNNKSQISKCNMIWSSMLKGKNWDDIESILQVGDFTAEKGTITKIRDLKDRQNKKREKTENQVKEKENENEQDTLEQLGVEMQEENVQEQVEETLQEEMIFDNKENIINKSSSLPIIKKNFEEEHPRLAKIPFFNKLFEKYFDKMQAKMVEEQDKKEVQKLLAAPSESEVQNIHEEQKVADDENKLENKNVLDSQELDDINVKNTKEISDKEWDYIAKEMEKNELETFKRIAENGTNGDIWKEQYKVELKNKRIEQKRTAAQREAQKFGSKYKGQEEFVNNQIKKDDAEIEK